MLNSLRDLIYCVDLDNDKNKLHSQSFLHDLDEIIDRAFGSDEQDQLLLVHQMLYEINMAHLSVAWIKEAKNIHNPLLCDIKYRINKAWQTHERNKHKDILASLPGVENFPTWIRKIVSEHRSNELHPIFTYIRDEASSNQVKEFFFQETPLEMLFGDIIALMLPGVYGSIKVELVKNYWDEVGRAVDEKVHRQLRARLMKTLDIPENVYLNNTEIFVIEELQLINMYLGLALDRTKHVQLVGTMLATELMIPGRFEYLIAGWRRLGISEEDLEYHIEHTSVDEVHADDLLDHVTMPILSDNPSQMPDIVLGVARRLDATVAVADRLYERMLKDEESFHLISK